MSNGRMVTDPIMVQGKPISILRLRRFPEMLPLDNAVRLELSEGVPSFCAPPQVQERIESLLEKQQAQRLTPSETEELQRYEELDDFLSLVNRLVRNLLQTAAMDSTHVPAT